MQIIHLAQCSRDLDFQPIHSWPEPLPAISWSGRLLAGFDRAHGMALDYSPTTNVTKLVLACHSSLGVFEILRLKSLLPALELPTPIQLKVSSIPQSFQNWSDRRQVTAGELIPFRYAESRHFPALGPLLNQLADLNPTRQTGIQMLELLIELLGLDTDYRLLQAPAGPADAWLKQLIRLRHPVALTKDSLKQQKLRQLPWPGHVHAQWVRRGDEASLEIQMRAQSPVDLKKRLHALIEISPEVESALWTN